MKQHTASRARERTMERPIHGPTLWLTSGIVAAALLWGWSILSLAMRAAR
ncbi:hypothetical protein dsx2_1491 [Desulfovibrio sp. X2]|nr:hypothetical protein [Desulfovibrio sp. X2]EPR44532.1 hypothetical protein dsx2_1491 [Desulfovibrio sp. X2]